VDADDERTTSSQATFASACRISVTLTVPLAQDHGSSRGARKSVGCPGAPRCRPRSQPTAALLALVGCI